jgi:N-methylhydantoinase A/oxoprolinase/acetone carboxylase beta subunit
MHGVADGGLMCGIDVGATFTNIIFTSEDGLAIY